MLHEAARVGRGPIVAVQVVLEHAQHRRLLATVMRGMCNPPDHNPCPGAFHVKKLNFFLPPRVILVIRTPFWGRIG